jgi:hypothetical protein
LFGINFETTLKNREIEGALALGGCHSINTYNNQMEVGVWGGGYIEEEARPREVSFCTLFVKKP